MSDDNPKPPGSDSNQPPAPPPPPPPPPPAGPPVPPPPPAAGPPPPGGGAPAPYSVSNAFSYGWAKFQPNIGPWLIAVVGAAVIMVAVQVIVSLFLGAVLGSTAQNVTVTVDPVTGEIVTTGGGGVGFLATLTFALLILIVSFVAWVIAAQFVRGGLETVRTGKVELGTFLKFDNIGTVVVGAIILAAIYFVLGLIGIIPILGWIVYFVGSIVVAFFSQFFLYFILDQEQGAVDSIKASFAFVNKNLVSVVLLYLASAVALFIGAILCLVGLLVAVPVVVMAHAYTYRSLNGESIAA